MKEDLEISLKMNLCWIFPEGPLNQTQTQTKGVLHSDT